MVHQTTLRYHTRGRGTTSITRDIADAVAESGVGTGLCHLFIHHTSASLILCENADPTVRSDLETFMVRLVPDGDPMFEHMDEGPDDMAAHVRSILTKMDLTIPVTDGRRALGPRQGVDLWARRHHGPHRKVSGPGSGCVFL